MVTHDPRRKLRKDAGTISSVAIAQPPHSLVEVVWLAYAIL